jgi:hypothetical protein
VKKRDSSQIRATFIGCPRLSEQDTALRTASSGSLATTVQCSCSDPIRAVGVRLCISEGHSAFDVSGRSFARNPRTYRDQYSRSEPPVCNDVHSVSKNQLSCDCRSNLRFRDLPPQRLLLFSLLHLARNSMGAPVVTWLSTRSVDVRNRKILCFHYLTECVFHLSRYLQMHACPTWSRPGISTEGGSTLDSRRETGLILQPVSAILCSQRMTHLIERVCKTRRFDLTDADKSSHFPDYTLTYRNKQKPLRPCQFSREFTCRKTVRI